MPSGYFQAVLVSEFLFLGTLVWVSGMKEAEGSRLAAPGCFGSFTLESGTWFCSVDSVSTAKANSWSPTSHGALLGLLSASHWMSLPEFSIRLWRSDNGFQVLGSFWVLTSSWLKPKVKPRYDNAHLPSQRWDSRGRRARGLRPASSLGYRKPNGGKNKLFLEGGCDTREKLPSVLLVSEVSWPPTHPCHFLD